MGFLNLKRFFAAEVSQEIPMLCLNFKRPGQTKSIEIRIPQDQIRMMDVRSCFWKADIMGSFHTLLRIKGHNTTFYIQSSPEIISNAIRSKRSLDALSAQDRSVSSFLAENEEARSFIACVKKEPASTNTSLAPTTTAPEEHTLQLAG